MGTRDRNAAEWLAAAAAALGVLVWVGYAIHSPVLVQLIPGPRVPVEPSTAASLILGALALLLSKRWRTISALLLLALNFVVLLEITTGLSLGADWGLGGGWLHEPALHPGRTSLLNAIGFLLLGAAILVLPWMQRRRAWIARWLTWLTLAVGVTGVLGYFLHLDLLYSYRGLARPAMLSGCGIFLLGLALWMQWRERRWNRPPPGAEQAEHIMQAARLALIVVIVVAGFSGLFMVQHIAERDAISDLTLRRQERISYVRLLIEEAVASGERYAQQPELTALLLQQPRAKPVLPPHDFSSVTLERGDRVVAHIGNEIRRPQVQVPLPLGGTVALLWDGAFYLRQRLPVVQGSHTLGAVELEQPLALLGSIGIESASFGSSGEIGLCGRAPAGAAVVCFPQRLHPEPYVLRTGFRDVADPMALALAGKSGVADTIDYRGQRVLAAYAPIAGMGLGLVVKMDSQELYAPIRLEVAILGPLLIALAIVGLELLRWQVRPLIAELVASRNQVASSEARFRAAAESGMDPFYIFESVRSRLTGGIASFRLIYANQPGEIFADLAAGGSGILGLSSVPQLAAAGDVLGQLRNVVVQRRYWVEEFTPGRGGDGAPQWLHLQAVPLGDGVAVTLRDISQRKREEDRLRAMAQTDALTGLANHSAFQKKLAQAMQNSQRHQRQRLLAVLYLDIDHFKQINDSHGHGVGDRVLQAFAARLLRAVRSADMVARPGGDEFAILLENLDSPRDAERVVASILAAMEDPMHIDDHLLPIHTSIGVAYYRGEALSGEGLQQRADAALYAAKRGGRNAWRVHSD